MCKKNIFLLGLLVNLCSNFWQKLCYLWKTSEQKCTNQLFIGIYQIKAGLTVISHLLVAKVFASLKLSWIVIYTITKKGLPKRRYKISNFSLFQKSCVWYYSFCNHPICILSFKGDCDIHIIHFMKNKLLTLINYYYKNLNLKFYLYCLLVILMFSLFKCWGDYETVENGACSLFTQGRLVFTQGVPHSLRAMNTLLSHPIEARFTGKWISFCNLHIYRLHTHTDGI